VEDYRDSLYDAVRLHNLEGCYIAGHSLGGAIAMSFALTYTDVLKGLIIIGSGARLKVLPQILENIKKDPEGTIRFIVNLSFSEMSPSILKKEDFNEVMKCNPEIILRDFNACNNFDIMDRVNQIHLPALIICGTDDMLTPSKYSYYLHREIKDSQLVLIEHGGHMVMWEKPEEVNRAIKQFVTCNLASFENSP